MQGHRQNFVEVKINEIVVNGKSFKEGSREVSSFAAKDFSFADSESSKRTGPRGLARKRQSNGT